MSTSMCWCARSTYLRLTLLLLILLTLSMSEATGPDGSVPTDDGITLRQRCGLRTCDLTTHYCDQVMGDCARCDDDCHPARIVGDAKAMEDCQRICQWYYRHQRLQHKEKKSSSTQNQISSSDVDDEIQIVRMSRAELRILIELEVLKSQTWSCLEKTFLVIFCCCVILLVARGWLYAGTNQGQLKSRFIADQNLL